MMRSASCQPATLIAPSGYDVPGIVPLRTRPASSAAVGQSIAPPLQAPAFVLEATSDKPSSANARPSALEASLALAGALAGKPQVPLFRKRDIGATTVPAWSPVPPFKRSA